MGCCVVVVIVIVIGIVVRFEGEIVECLFDEELWVDFIGCVELLDLFETLFREACVDIDVVIVADFLFDVFECCLRDLFDPEETH